MTYGEIFVISLYRVIGRIRVMTLHLGVLNEESDMRVGHGIVSVAYQRR